MKTTPQSEDDASLARLTKQIEQEYNGTVPDLVIHPPASDLYDAVTGDLSTKDEAEVKNHILVCEMCKRSTDGLLVSLIDDGVWREFGPAHLAVYGEEVPKVGKPFVWRPAASERVMAALLKRWSAKELAILAGRESQAAVIERAIGTLALRSTSAGVFDENLARSVVDRYVSDEQIRVRASSTSLLSDEEARALRSRASDPFLRALAAGRVLRSWAASPDERARVRAVCGRPPPGPEIESIRAGCDKRVAVLEREMGARIAAKAQSSVTPDDGAKSWRLIAWRDDLESIVVALSHMRSNLPASSPKAVEQAVRIAEHRLLSDLRAFDKSLGPHLAAIKLQMRSAFSTAAQSRIADRASDRLATVSVHGEDGYWFQLALDARELDATQWLTQVARPAADEILVDLQQHPIFLCDHTEGQVATTASTFQHRGQEYSLKVASVTRAKVRQLVLVVQEGSQRIGGISVVIGERVLPGTPAVFFQMPDATVGAFRVLSRSIGLDMVAHVSRTRESGETRREEVAEFLEDMVGRSGLKSAQSCLLAPCARCSRLKPAFMTEKAPTVTAHHEAKSRLRRGQ